MDEARRKIRICLFCIVMIAVIVGAVYYMNDAVGSSSSDEGTLVRKELRPDKGTLVRKDMYSDEGRLVRKELSQDDGTLVQQELSPDRDGKEQIVRQSEGRG